MFQNLFALFVKNYKRMINNEVFARVVSFTQSDRYETKNSQKIDNNQTKLI